MKIIPVHPDDSRAALAETSQLQQAGATKLSTGRTFGKGYPTRRTFGKGFPTRRTFGKGFPTRRTFGVNHP